MTRFSAAIATFFGVGCVLAAACGDDDGSSGETTTGGGATGGLDLMTVGSGAGGSGASGSGGSGAGCDGMLAGGDPAWSAAYGSGAVVFGVDVHASGAVAVIGSFDGTLDIGATTLTSNGGDVFVAVFDASGAPQWAKSFGGAMDQSGRGVAFDGAGNVILVGQFRGSIDFGGGNLTSLGCCFEDFFIAKLDASGNYVWQKQLGDDDIDRVKDVAVSQAGEIVITGQYQDELSLGGGVTLPATTAGDLNAFVAKLDATGNGIWGVGFGDQVDQDGHAVAIDGQGNVLVTGQFAGSIDIGTGALASEGDVSAFVAKLSSAGAPQWAKAFGQGNAVGDAIGADADGNVVVGGTFRGAIDFGSGPITSNQSDDVFVLSFDPSGDLSSSEVYGTDSAQTVDGIAVSADGEAVVVGSFAGSIDFGAGPLTADGALDAYVAKLRADLCPAFQHVFGGAGEQVARNVAVGASGEVIVVGNFDGTVDIGGESLTASGDDIFVVELDP